MILLWIAAPFIVLPVLGLVYQRYAEARDWRRLSPFGRLEPVSLHVDVRGEGTPPILFESGLAATSLSWALVQEHLSRRTQTIAYDRAGLGWSPGKPGAVELGALVEQLSNVLLQHIGEQPAILAGHSFGSLIVRAFAARYPARVQSLVLVDPVSPSYWSTCTEANRKRLALGAKLARRGAVLARFGIVRLCLQGLVSGRRRLPRLLSNVSGGKGKNLVNRLTREMSRLPAQLWPALIAHWSRPASFRVMARYLESLVDCAREGSSLQVPSSIPITVISAGTATDAEGAEREGWVERSNEGELVHVPDSSHWIQLQRPEIVIAALERRLKAARTLPW